MGAKNCPETPRQKMINMMYIVLTAMLALNVAAEVLEAFKVVDISLLQTLETVDMKNAQVYARFEQAFAENETRVKEWKEKADIVKEKTDSLILFIGAIKKEMAIKSGATQVTEAQPLASNDFFLATADGDTLKISKADDLNVPSEFMITQKKATELKERVEEYRATLISLIDDSDEELRNTIMSALHTSDPKANIKEGGESKSWETERFLDKPLVAVLTLLSKIQIDVKNSEANLINYLYSQIDAGSFLFNKLGARVIPNSSMILQGDEYVAEVFLAAEDTTQQPEILINGRSVPVHDGKATYRIKTSEPGVFSWSGLIKYKTPAGIIKNYSFKQEYQVTQPSVTMSATRMNVFYRGLNNPFDVSGGGIPRENLEVTMTNGTVSRSGDAFIIKPNELDEPGRRTTVSVHANIGGERRLLGTSNWRVKRVPDPVAHVAGQAGGTIRKERLLVEDGVLAVLEDFDFDFKYTVTQFRVEISSAGGYVNFFESNSNRFTPEQKDQFRRLNPNSLIYIANIKAVGDDGTTRDIAPISFKIQ
ncbi:gliding motility-associated protein GldM [Mariniphaga anaerophila]|uniref:Gliding motility-associated protein GldM n=1 Tax=Mariniphaga anaerophila TaxID=1484053 RepID=A0A1M5FS21_9BACT|nr:gliding motility protein GldM [Mariniphaga anaerophila]SHF94266.1 gliding motility-associated protein GldM [Mariniphaga anaerophila]